MGDKKLLSQALHPLEGMLSCWSRLHLQWLLHNNINPHWARVVGLERSLYV
jgi:hypothetical protein